MTASAGVYPHHDITVSPTAAYTDNDRRRGGRKRGREKYRALGVEVSMRAKNIYVPITIYVIAEVLLHSTV